eukprot:TRINITY_DN439_c0_g1_i7.p1 TRINITY_DN439_c0_g1~~TRINITY_DN439_c0_g1_i7.p1  ORF type:complete len:490 (+),score=133.88 TRINITY_DN439_c0_g1_i7:66-1472(+)
MPASREWEQLSADQQKLSELLHRIAADTAAANELAASVQWRLAAQLQQRRAAQRRAEEEWCDAFDAELDGMVASAGFLLQLLFEPDGRRASVRMPIDGTIAQLQAAVHSEGGPVPPLQVLAVGGERLMHLGRTLLSDTRLIRPGVCVTVRRRDPRRRCVGVSHTGRLIAILDNGDVWCPAERGAAETPKSMLEVSSWVRTTANMKGHEKGASCFGYLGDVASVHCGANYLAVLADGKVLLWSGVSDAAWSAALRQLDKEVVCFSASSCLDVQHGAGKLAAVDSDGQLWLLDKAGTTVPAVLYRRAAAVSVSSGMAVVLTTDGQVCTLSHYWPEEPNWVHLGGRPAVAVSAGSGHGAALLDDGSVRCFGDNTYGQCNVPSGLRDVVSVECNEVSTFAVLSDGGISWWGRRQHWPEEPFSPHFGAGCCTAVAAGVHSLVTVSADSRLARYWSGAGEQPLAAQPSGRLASG